MNKRMKKYISVLLAVVLAFTCFTGLTLVNAQDSVEINSVNFPDDNFRNVVLANYDTDDTKGFLSTEEADAVTVMLLPALSEGDITTLKGIEYFTQLTRLFAGDLGIEEADLSALTKLQTLRINGNALTSLDVSANTALQVLNCRGNAQLTSLKVPASVTDLQCDECALTQLDLSACTGLKTLNCYGNELTSLDLSHNTELTELRCASNHLTALDLSHNTALTGVMTSFIGEQTVNAAATASGKTISVPVSGIDPAFISYLSLADGSYNAQTGAFEFSDYGAAQSGFDYNYNVNLANAEVMSVQVNVSKDFYKASYYASEGGELIDYSYVTAGSDAVAPAFPQAPEGFVCPAWSADGKNIQADTDIYTVWSESHTYTVVAYSNLTATISCSVCGDTYQKSLYDCFNAKRGEADYDEAMDYNHDGYINSRDHALLIETFG